MWRVTLGLCLIAAVSGTPLRQAEAADDLARMLSHHLERCDIQPQDTGVGDEPEVATCKLGVSSALLLARDLTPCSHGLVMSFLPIASPSLLSRRELRYRGWCRRHLASPTRMRLAWLQMLLV